MTHPTRAYTLAELDLLPPSVVMETQESFIRRALASGIEPLEILNVITKPVVTHMPIRSYAAAVVDRFESLLCGFERGPTILVSWCVSSWGHPELIFHRVNHCKTHFYCPTNPFLGLLNPDGTQRTSCTREELEAWKRGEVV